MRPLKLLIPFICGVLILTGCSGGASEPVGVSDIPEVKGVESPAVEDDSQRVLWGVWEIAFDTVTMKIMIEPIRNAGAHFDVTDMITPPACDDCIEIAVNSFDPVTRILDADVTLRNPYAISGYDVRGILYTNDYGHLLKNADDWTKLFEQPGGQSLNPFKAFAKDETNRKFAAEAEHTQNYRIYIPQPPNYWAITFAVTASWPGNCREPYELENFSHAAIYDNVGSSGIAVIAVWDWQKDVSDVRIEIPEITGEDSTPFIHFYKRKRYAWINNVTGAAAGVYPARITAKSEGSGDTALYDFVTITISGGPPSGWARTWGGSDGPDYGIDIALDGDGNIFTTGVYVGTADFDPGPDVDEHSAEIDDYDVFISKLDPSGNFLWARTWGSPGDDEGCGLAIDDNGNSYISGTFSNTVDFDPGPDVQEHTPEGQFGYYLSKFDPGGSLLWTRTWEGAFFFSELQVAVDAAGDILVTSDYEGTVDFNPGTGVEERTSNGGRDAFLSKFDTAGSFQWVRTWGGTSEWGDDGRGVQSDSSGNIFVIGDFSGTVDFNPGPGIDELVASGENDIFLSKFSQSGDFQWVRSWGGQSFDTASDIEADSSGSVLITGTFSGICDFNPGPGVDEHVADGTYDCFISMLNTGGEFQWARTWGGYADEFCSGVGVDDSGYVWVTGSYLETVDFDPGVGIDVHSAIDYYDAYFSKFTSDGDFLFARTWGGIHIDACGAIDIDNSGNAYITGNYHGPADLDPGPVIDMRTAFGFQDIYISKFPPSGDW